MAENEHNALLRMTLRPLEPFLVSDNFEILINRPHEVWTDNARGMQAHTVSSLSEKFNLTLLKLIASSCHKVLDIEHPILKTTWKNEITNERWRVTGVILPVTNTVEISFRRLRATPLTDAELIEKHYFNKEAFTDLSFKESNANTSTPFHPVKTDRYEFMCNAIKAKKNMVISGSTGSSKTQFLNWCISKIHEKERIVTIEDTEELVIKQPNHVQLFYADDITQSECPVDATRLLKLALRLRPDRIIMGEVRGTELADMLESANTGHPGTFVTLHADSPEKAFLRMRQILLRVYPMQSAVMLDEWLYDRIDIVVQCKRQGGRFFIDDLWEKKSEY